jgi:S-adenosylmethionine:tRNA ribosyltransferase-isomerase
MKTSDFDFDLPTDLIAQYPAATRRASRLLQVNGGRFTDRMFSELPQLVRPGDLMVFNDTRVIKARLHGHKETGGAIEVLVERVIGASDPVAHTKALAHVRASKSPMAGSRLDFPGGVKATVTGRQADLFVLDFGRNVYELLETIGAIPLPPYITHSPDDNDQARYQTVYAQHAGSVAAPTAGLHFDEAMLAELERAGVETAFVTLHVGAGTFRPVRDDDPAKHVMHHEWYNVPTETSDAVARARRRGGRVIAVGTTSMRTLESAATSKEGGLRAGSAETNLFITPGYQFSVVDRLITNFHLPKSTLMMLVSAFAGHRHIMGAYAHAIAQRYRFFSYGDAMLLEREMPAEGQ